MRSGSHLHGGDPFFALESGKEFLEATCAVAIDSKEAFNWVGDLEATCAVAIVRRKQPIASFHLEATCAVAIKPMKEWTQRECLEATCKVAPLFGFFICISISGGHLHGGDHLRCHIHSFSLSGSHLCGGQPYHTAFTQRDKILKPPAR